MCQRDGLTPNLWAQVVDEMDRAVHSAVCRYVRCYPDARVGLPGKRRYLRERLIAKADPGYSDRRIVLAYAFEYLVRRAVSVYAAMNAIPERADVRRILDIGSGSGAASLGLMAHAASWRWPMPPSPGAPLIVVQMDPSREMHEFGTKLPVLSSVARAPRSGNWESIGKECSDAQVAYFDLIISSAALPHSDASWASSMWDAVAAGLARRLRPAGHLLLIEPNAKKRPLNKLVHYVKRSGAFSGPSDVQRSQEFERVITTPRSLPRLTDLYRRLTGVDEPTVTWNRTKSDEVRVLQRRVP